MSALPTTPRTGSQARTEGPRSILARAFGLDSDWVRPLHRRRALRTDAVIAISYAVLSVVLMDTARSVGKLATAHLSDQLQYAIVLFPIIGLMIRRLYPMLALLLAIGHFASMALIWPEMSPVFGLQIYYFFSLFSAIAWARNRQAVLWLTALMAATVTLWVLSDVLLSDAWDRLSALPYIGPFPPAPAALAEAALSTATFFVAATAAGSGAWWSAHREATAKRQAGIIEDQVAQLSEQALSEERLRIARELHDAVGHSVAVMGIQAAAAERLIGRDREQASEALGQSQLYARTAAKEMRLLLNALRAPSGESEGLVANPGLTGLSTLIDRFGELGLEVEVQVHGDVDQVPRAQSQCAFRVVQEAMTNVQRHATADTVRVELQVDSQGVDSGRLRVEVTNTGPAKGTSSGSQLGLVGMRERVALYGGTLSAGPGPGGDGFEVVAELSWLVDG